MAATAIPIIVGATGTGKTALALELARRNKAEVISADSRQIYRKLSVGTAKPTGRWVKDLNHPLGRYYAVEGIPHHLVDFLEPTEIYSAGRFAQEAETLLNLPGPWIVAGGTGLYLRALVDGLAPLPPRDPALRKTLLERAQKDGRPSLHAELARVDPSAAQAIPPNNIARLVRALEVYLLTGQPLSQWQREKTNPSPRSFAWIGLRWPKDVLEKHLQERCRRMIREGFLEETKSLLETGLPSDAPALQSLGYRSAVEHLQGRLSREEWEEQFLRETRLYAKRQMTWFRANPRIRWLDVPGPFDPISLASKMPLD